MLLTAGIDIGSTASKAVIMDDNKVLSAIIGPSSTNPAKNARNIFEEALGKAGFKESDVNYSVGTGYGRAHVPFANDNISEISCHGRGAHFFLPTVRTIIDIGGQDTKTICVDNRGMLLDFAMNDKCAAGTGRFLEAIIRNMEIKLEDMEKYHFQDGEPCTISSMCSVFAESEVINLVNEGIELSRIIKGLHISLANRVVSLAKRVGVIEDVAVTGGVAKNRGVLDAIEKKLKIALKRFPEGVDPQIVGAVGAAILAKDKLSASAK